MVYSLEGLRGIAALVVALFHGWDSRITTPFVNGWLCVDLFFVISGFVMAHVYRRMDTGAQIAGFGIKRFGRLYPLHLVTLFGVIACEMLLQGGKALSPLAGHATNPPNFDLVERWSFASNLLLLNGMGVPGARQYNGVSWSISTEIWAYALFAATSFLLRSRLRLLVWAALSLTGLVLWFSSRHGNYISNGTYFFRCVYGFFLGALLPGLRDRLRPGPAFLFISQVVAVALTLAVFVAVQYLPSIKFAAPAAFALLVLMVSFDNGPIPAVLKHRTIQSLGRLSYSIYMTHILILVFFNPVGEALLEPYRSLFKFVYVAVLLVVSMLTYRLIEQPWRLRFRRYTGERSRRDPITAALNSAP